MSLYLNDNLKRVYEKASLFFQRHLQDGDGSDVAREYLQNRGINKEVSEKFSIGWCPNNVKIGKKLAPLKGRVIFPIKDEYGDILSFSGRMLVSKEEIKSGEKRWWNESYDKSFFFYGLDVALPSILKYGYVIIVEGQTDVVSCHRFGLSMAIGLTSKDLTEKHLLKLSRIALKVILLLDGDDVGRKSSKSIKKTINDHLLWRPQGFEVFDLSMKSKQRSYDPDEFLRKVGPMPIVNAIKGFLKEDGKEKGVNDEDK